MTSEEIIKLTFEHRSSMQNFRNEFNSEQGQLLIKAIEQRRDFYKQILNIAAAVLGLSPFFFDKTKLHEYMYVALIILALVIFIVVAYLRELVDQDQKGIQAQRDKYNSIFNKALKANEDYLNTKSFTDESYASYLNRINELSEVGDFTKELELLENQRNQRLAGVSPVEYPGEFLVLLLMTGFVFLILSFVLDKPLAPHFVVIILFGITYFSLSDFAGNSINVFSFIARILKKEIKLRKKSLR
jgi:ABC-type multidrug transport system fused ATPase/permease subunit